MSKRGNSHAGIHKHDVSSINVGLIGDRSLNGVGLQPPKKLSANEIKKRRAELLA